jgi:hypothetical protein
VSGVQVMLIKKGRMMDAGRKVSEGTENGVIM